MYLTQEKYHFLGFKIWNLLNYLSNVTKSALFILHRMAAILKLVMILWLVPEGKLFLLS